MMGDTIIMPSAIRIEAITISMTRKGRNSRNPIWKAVFKLGRQERGQQNMKGHRVRGFERACTRHIGKHQQIRLPRMFDHEGLDDHAGTFQRLGLWQRAIQRRANRRFRRFQRKPAA